MLSKNSALAAKEMGLVLLLLWMTLSRLGVEQVTLYLSLTIFALTFASWKVGHRAHLGWSRLEHAHRVAEEEHWEGREVALPVCDHPLKEAVAVGLGTLVAMATCALALLCWPTLGMALAALLLVTAGTTLSAISEGNRIFPALVWNLALAGWSAGLCLFAVEFVLR